MKALCAPNPPLRSRLCFDVWEDSIISSPISTSHLVLHVAIYTFKNSKNLVNFLLIKRFHYTAFIILTLGKFSFKFVLPGSFNFYLFIFFFHFWFHFSLLFLLLLVYFFVFNVLNLWILNFGFTWELF